MIPTFSFHDFVTQKELGAGSFSRVYLVHLGHSVSIDDYNFYPEIDKMKISSFALKCPIITEDDDDASMLMKVSQLKHEANLLSELNHPNIVTLRALPRDETCPSLGYFLVMDCLQRETLQIRIKTNLSRVSIRDRIQNIALDVVKAMKYIHSKGLELRDLKPDNIGFDENTGRAQVFDFGLARRVNMNGQSDIDDEMAGSLRYMAPEAMLGKSCQASDVYSFGLVLWEIITLKKPYFEVQRKFHLKHQSGDLVAHIIDLVTKKNEQAGPMWHVRSKQLRKIITSCCEYDSNLRPSFDDVDRVLTDSLEHLERRLSFGLSRLKGSQLFGSLASFRDGNTSQQGSHQHGATHTVCSWPPLPRSRFSLLDNGARHPLPSLTGISSSKSSSNILSGRPFLRGRKLAFSFGYDEDSSERSSCSWLSKRRRIKVRTNVRGSSLSMMTETGDSIQL
jgi:serine/threonine protein kinase